MSKRTKTQPNTQDLDDSVLLEPKEERLSSADESEYEAPPVVKPKRVLSEAQIQALARGRAKGRARLNEKHNAINEAKKAREAELAQARAEAEQRVKDIVVKKAVQIKKKEMLAKIELDEIESDEDDDIPVEAIRRVVAKAKAKQPPAQIVPKKPTPAKREEQYKPVHHYNPQEAYGYQRPVQEYQRPVQEAIKYNFI